MPGDERHRVPGGAGRRAGGGGGVGAGEHAGHDGCGDPGAPGDADPGRAVIVNGARFPAATAVPDVEIGLDGLPLAEDGCPLPPDWWPGGRVQRDYARAATSGVPLARWRCPGCGQRWHYRKVGGTFRWWPV
jgi:hypothetical protein